SPQLGKRRVAGRQVDERVVHTRGGETLVHGLEPCRALGMASAGIVSEKHGVPRDEEHSATVRHPGRAESRREVPVRCPEMRGYAAAAVAIIVGVACAAPASAQTAATPAPKLELVAQTAWTPVGGDFTMRLRATGSTAGLELTLTVYQQLTSRTAFDAS